MIKDADEFTKKELYGLVKLLKLKPVSKATKPMLVSMINKAIDGANKESGILLESPLVGSGIDSKPDVHSKDIAEVVKSVEPEVEEISEEVFKGFHPITGEPVK